MKIMFFVCALRMGGSERACVRMANALCEKHDVTIITMWGRAGLEREVDSRVRLIHKFPRYIRGIANISGRVKPEIIHRFYIADIYDAEIAVGDGLESHVVSGSLNPNKYSWIHINLGNNGTKRSERSIKRYRQFKKIICVSEENKRCFEKEMGSSFPTIVAYTPVDTKKILELAEKPGEVPFNTFVAVGRLEKVKGYERLIEAMKTVDAKLYIYGDGTKRIELLNLIRSLKLGDRVFLQGTISNPYPYIKAAKALICSSYEESFGFAALEAMLLKTPVLSTKCGGVEEIISKPEYGLICDNSLDGLTAGLKKLINGDNTVDVEKAYMRALDFSVEHCLERFEKIIGLT